MLTTNAALAGAHRTHPKDQRRGLSPLPALLATLFCGLFLLAGCGPGLPDADEGAREGILLTGNGGDPKTLDPLVSTGVPEAQIINSILEGLINYHPVNDNLPEPGVASSWEHNEDYSTWTFHLRPDARWSNGDTVTAHDFVYSFKRMLDPKFLGEYAQMLFQLKNGEAYKMGELKDFGQVGARALDDHTLLIELRGPTPYFLSMLKHHAWFPVHPGTVDSTGAYFDLSGRWTRPSTFIGNGPFVLKEWKDYQWIYVEKSPTYWDSGRVRLKGIYFFPIEDNNTEMRMFRSGQLHMTNTVPTNDLPIMREQGDPRLRLEPAISTYFYFFNTTRPPLDNVLVRRALSLAIDRQTIVDKVTLGGQKPAGSMVPPEFEDYQPPDNAVSFNPEEARRLLAEAGYPNGEGFPRVELLFNTSEGHRKIAEAIVEMWAKHLNIKPVLDNTEWKVFLDRQSHLDYDVSRSGWLGDYLDPITFLELFRTGNGNNDSGWSNPRYDALIEAAFVAPSPDEHYRLMREAEAILVEDMPIAPVYFYTRAYMLDPRVQNWNPAPMEYRPWKYIWLDPEASVGKAE